MTRRQRIGLGFLLGLAVGIAVGTLTGNPGAWIGIGTGSGILISGALANRRRA